MKNLTIEITDSCSLACMHCSTYGSWDREDIFMSVDEFEKHLRQNKPFKEIRLSGGEPFMHPEIVNFASIAKRDGREVNILSCGVFRKANDYTSVPEQIIQDCREYVDSINLSLHGSEKTHEQVVGVPETFKFLDRTLDRIIQAKIPFSFGFVPLKTNAQDLEGAVKYVSEKAKQVHYCAPGIHLLRYVRQGGNQYDEDVFEKVALTQEENQQVIRQAKLLQEEYNLPISITCSMFEKGCTASTNKKVISVYGEVYDCSALKWMPIPNSSKDCACIGRH